MKDTTSTISYYKTNIESLDALLEKPPSSENRSTQGIVDDNGILHKPQYKDAKGIAYYDDIGFFGVVFGAAGSGKSILGIQLCCRFLWPGTKPQASKPGARVAIYLTQEEPGLIQAKIAEFHFVPSFEYIYTHGGLNYDPSGSNPGGFDAPGLHIVKMPLDVERQKALLENVSDELAQINRNAHGRQAGNEKHHNGTNVLVCVDICSLKCDVVERSFVGFLAPDTGAHRAVADFVGPVADRILEMMFDFS